MSFVVVCDGCGALEPATVNILGDPLTPMMKGDPPRRWRALVARDHDKATMIHGCSEECWELARERSKAS